MNYLSFLRDMPTIINILPSVIVDGDKSRKGRLSLLSIYKIENNICGG